MRKFYPLFLLGLSLFITSSPNAQSAAISYTTVTSGLSAPVEVVNAGDGTNRLFIVQQGGAIRVFDPANGGLQATPFLNISSLVLSGGEQGLLSMAFHPDYETNGYFFVYYNNLDGDVTLARYRASSTSNVADAGSGQVLFSIDKPFDNHNGAHLQFGQDGHLYFGTGDGGSGNDPNNNAQNGLSLLGKMIRINVDNFTTAPYYTVPADNPFVGNAAYDPRVWAVGLRNPFRWSFDRQTGDMWIGDVGQGAKEEVNYTPASSNGGENYGWKCYEGTIPNPNIPPCAVPNHHPPVFEYDNPASGPSSVVGGYVYRGTEYPFFNGYYIASDVYSGTAYLLKPNGSGGFSSRVVTGLPTFIVGYGEGEDGTLYAVRQSTGTLLKLVPNAAVLPIRLSSFTVKSSNNGNELKWTTAMEENISRFVIEYSTNGSSYTAVGEVAASGAGNGSSYAFTHTISPGAVSYYRLRIVERVGSDSYSSVVKVNGKESGYQLYPTLIKSGRFYVVSNGPVSKIQVLNNTGSKVYEMNANATTGQIMVQLPPMARGMYVVRVIGEKAQSKMIFIE